MRTRRLILLPILFVAALATAGMWKDHLVLKIGNPEVMVPVSEGDVFFRTYIHSMYQVPVSEKFRIEDGHLRLVHVQTQSEAVLVYQGLEGKNEPNADGQFTEFLVSAASIGNHVLRFHDRDIALGTREDRDGSIKVELSRIPLFTYFAHLVWR